MESNQAKSMWTNPVPINKPWFDAQNLIQFLAVEGLIESLDRGETKEGMQLWEIFPSTDALDIQDYTDYSSEVF